MNTFEIFHQWLLPASARASVLVLVVLSLQFVLGRWLPARWRHALWLPVVLVLLLPVLPQSRFSVENRFQTKSTFVQAEPLSAVVLPGSFVESQTAPQSVSRQPDWRHLVFATWLLGACTVLIAGGIGYRRSLRRITGDAVMTREDVNESVAREARQLGLKRVPRVIMSPSVDSPAVAGLLRPVLLLPATFPQGFSANEARLILLHELTHLKRHDLPLNWLLCLLQAVHWFNPVLWFAFGRMRADREAACDAQVLGAGAEDRRADYGHALLKLHKSMPHPGLSLAFVGIFQRAGMRSRIRAIAAHHRPHPALGLATGVLIAALTLVGATRAQETKSGDAQDVPKAAAPGSPGKDAPATQGTDQHNKAGWGRFVSFKDGTLTLKGNHGVLVWNNITDKTKVVHWDTGANEYKPSGTSEILGKVEAGTWIMVSDGKALVRVGARKGTTTGTFVSFKNDRLLMLGKDLGESFTKKYGNQLHFNKFAEGVPVYESIDGEEYTLIGTAEKILPTLKEGTIVTTHAEGDDNITRIDLGVRRKK